MPFSSRWGVVGPAWPGPDVNLGVCQACLRCNASKDISFSHSFRNFQVCHSWKVPIWKLLALRTALRTRYYSNVVKLVIFCIAGSNNLKVTWQRQRFFNGINCHWLQCSFSWAESFPKSGYRIRTLNCLVAERLDRPRNCNINIELCKEPIEKLCTQRLHCFSVWRFQQ